MSVVLRVEEPGVFTTVQDLGRPGHRLAGVPEGGAMDRFALVAANLLVGNPEGAAALECTMAGPVLVADAPCLVAVTGGDFQPAVNEQEVASWTSLFLARGDRLTVKERRSGARCYIAIGGGIKAGRWLGSASTYLLIARGGIEGRPLKKKDVIETAEEPPRPLVAGRQLPASARPPYEDAPTLRAVTGPHWSRVSRRSRADLFGGEYEVSNESDRMGYRLEGPGLEMRGKDILSFGVAFGCLQVPASGKPILLMADHQTAGGYPIVAAVARADLPLAAQVLPGAKLRFSEIGVGAAQDAWRRLQAGLDLLRKRPSEPRAAPPRRRAAAAPATAPTASGRAGRGRG